MNYLATFARVYVTDIKEGIALFGGGPNAEPKLRVSRESGLEVALVGDILVMAGSDEVLEVVRSTQVTIIVDDLDEVIEHAAQFRGSVVRPLRTDNTGRTIKFQFPGGSIVEFVEWLPELLAQAGL